MTPDQLRELVECPGWRWMEGMHDDNGYVVVASFHGRPYTSERGVDPMKMLHHPLRDGSLPDPTDPATTGCLEALVAEAWDDPYTRANPLLRAFGPADDVPGWGLHARTAEGSVWVRWEVSCGGRLHVGPTKFEALAKALIAAPRGE